MKRLVELLLGVVLLSSGMAHAQSILWMVKASIPFEFNVGNRTMPAGQYSLVQLQQHSVQLRNARGEAIAFAFTSGVMSPGSAKISKLKFRVKGGHHILEQVWLRGSQIGEQLYRSKAEERQLEMNGPSTVAWVPEQRISNGELHSENSVDEIRSEKENIHRCFPTLAID